MNPSLYGDTQPTESVNVNAGAEPPAPEAPSPTPADPSIAPVPQQQLSQPGQPMPEGKQPFWKTLLQGALNGIAGSAGAHNWGQALGMGVAGEQKFQQQQFDNKLQQQQADQASQMNQAHIKFMSTQDAMNAANLANMGHQLNLADQASRDAHDEVVLKQLDYERKGGRTYHFVPGGQTENHLAQQSTNNPAGAQVPSGSFLMSTGTWVPDTDDENYANSSYAQLKALGPYYGLPVPGRGDFFSTTPANREKLLEKFNWLKQGLSLTGAPIDPKAIDGAIKNTQDQIIRASADADADTIVPALQLTLKRLQNAKAGNRSYRDETTNDAIKVAGARGMANNMTRVVDAIDPDTGEARPMTNAERLKSGAVAVAPGMKAGGLEAQRQDIVTGSQSARMAINALDTPLTPTQVAKLSLVMKHTDPGILDNEITNFLGTQQLTPQQQDFVVAIQQLNERALSLRNVAGMGQGSDQLRTAIQKTLPGAASGSREMMLKQLDAFDQQVQQLGSGIPKVRGLAGHTAPGKSGGGPNVGDTKTFPNGRKGVWDGKGWVAQ